MANGSNFLRKSTYASLTIVSIVLLVSILVAVSLIEELYKGKVTSPLRFVYYPTVQALADLGWEDAQLLIAYRYADPKSESQDYSKALYWFRQAADAGHPRAYYALGVANYEGLGTPVDFAAAYDWFSEAAKIGHLRAKHMLGQLHFEGQGTEVDRRLAKTLWLESSDLPESQYALGVLLLNGDGLENEKATGLMWLFKARQNDFPNVEQTIAKWRAVLTASTVAKAEQMFQDHKSTSKNE